MGSLLKRVPFPDRVEHTLDDALDRGLAVQAPAVRKYVARLRAKDPSLTPADVAAVLEKRYRQTVMGLGGASGAAAAVPGVGTAASLATGAGEITAFIAASAMYVLGLAELHGVPIEDPDQRRALVLSVLVGQGARRVVTEGVAGGAAAGPHWASVLGRAASKGGTPRGAAKEGLSSVNGRLTRMLLTRFGARQGALVFGRALPLGLGAGVGALGNVALARGVVATARKAFGPPPERFPVRLVGTPVDPQRT